MYCTVLYCTVFLTMNVTCSKYVEDKKKWIKTLIWKVYFCWLTFHTCVWLTSYNCTRTHGTNSITMHIACYAPLSITESTIAGTVCPDMLQSSLTPHSAIFTQKDETPTYCQNATRPYTDNLPFSTWWFGREVTSSQITISNIHGFSSGICQRQPLCLSISDDTRRAQDTDDKYLCKN
jgi:hypothetical protein